MGCDGLRWAAKRPQDADLIAAFGSGYRVCFFSLAKLVSQPFCELASVSEWVSARLYWLFESSPPLANTLIE